MTKKMCRSCGSYHVFTHDPPCDTCYPSSGYPGWHTKDSKPKLQEVDETYPCILIEVVT